MIGQRIHTSPQDKESNVLAFISLKDAQKNLLVSRLNDRQETETNKHRSIETKTKVQCKEKCREKKLEEKFANILDHTTFPRYSVQLSTPADFGLLP